MLLPTIIVGVLLVANKVDAFVRRDVSSTNSQPNILESFQRNIDQLRNCIDQSLAKAASEVNEKQLEPVIAVVGDQLNRISKAFEVLTVPKTPPKE
ncbi:unnamed protein product [Parnassius apollo]|uniref:(apollo) hypothetical protein n=1 Tax=Parnassius apollo TaxID=110799 RepID=A0A8S3Y3R2_PARAO|nr:unnamed protein product [Parnassius apollo]